MSVVEVKKMSVGREAGEEIEEIADQPERTDTARESWKVLVSSRLDDHLTVLEAPGLPQINQIYVGSDGASEPAMRVKTRRARISDESPFLWIVDVEYSTHILDPEKLDDDPLLRPPLIRWQTVRYQRPFIKDQDGKPFVNSAGVRLEEDFDDARLVLSIEKNKTTYNPAQAFVYMNATNSDVFFGAQPGQFRVAQFDGEEDYKKGKLFWKVSYAFEFRPEGWTMEALDQGKAERLLDNNGNYYPVPIRDKDSGAYISDPVPLNGLGGEIRKTTFVLDDAINAETTGPGFSLIATGEYVLPSFPCEVRIGDEVIRILDDSPYSIVRGYAGTTAAAHDADDPVTLEPVFLRFRAYPSLPFAALGLP